MDRYEALALGRGRLRAPGRWETNLARYIRKIGVSRLVEEFNSDPDPNLHITNQTIYHWIAGKNFPRPACAVRLVETSGGEITYEDLFQHSIELGRIVPCQPAAMPEQRLTGLQRARAAVSTVSRRDD